MNTTNLAFIKVGKLLLIIAIISHCSELYTQEKLIPKQAYSFSPWGFVDDKGKTKIAPKFKTASEFYGNLAYVSDENGYFLINKKGKRIIKENCKEIKFLADCDSSFLIVIENGYDSNYIPLFLYNVVKQDGQKILSQNSGYINPIGKLIIYRVDGINGSSRFGVANSSGIIVAEAVNYWQPRFYNGITSLKTIINGVEKSGLIKHTGEIIVPFEYESTGKTYSDYFYIFWAKSFDKKYIFFDKDGKKIENIEADSYQEMSNYEPKLKLKKENKFGFFDGKKLVVKCEYDDVSAIDDNFYKVEINKKIGIINNGETIIPTKFDNIIILGDSLFKAKTETNTFLFDYKGREIAVYPKETEIVSFKNKIGIIRQNGKYGYIDKTGNIILPCKYDDAYSFNDGKARVIIFDTYKGYIDIAGNQISENEYIKEKIEAEKNAELAKIEQAKAEELVRTAKAKTDAEADKKAQNLNTFFPYRFSNSHYSIRLSKEPSINETKTLDWGTHQAVESTNWINSYMFFCRVTYSEYNYQNVSMAKALNISLLEAHKRKVEKTGLKIESAEYCKFKGFDAIRYYFSNNDAKARAISLQVKNIIITITLIGSYSYYGDDIFDSYINTFELK